MSERGYPKYIVIFDEECNWKDHPTEHEFTFKKMSNQKRIAIRPDGQRFLCDVEFSGIPESWGKVRPGVGMGKDYYNADGSIKDELFLEMPMPEFEPRHAEGFPKTVPGNLADNYAEENVN